MVVRLRGLVLLVRVGEVDLPIRRYCPLPVLRDLGWGLFGLFLSDVYLYVVEVETPIVLCSGIVRAFVFQAVLGVELFKRDLSAFQSLVVSAVILSVWRASKRVLMRWPRFFFGGWF